MNNKLFSIIGAIIALLIIFAEIIYLRQPPENRNCISKKDAEQSYIANFSNYEKMNKLGAIYYCTK